jgi:transposase-like protein
MDRFTSLSWESLGMPESEVKNVEITPKPKCLRCGAEHTVSYLGHWEKGWWTCAVCNIRWEEDEFE